MLLQSQSMTVKADSQSGYYDITLTTNNNGGGNGGTTTDPGGNGSGSTTGSGDQSTNGNNGGNTQTTKAPGSTMANDQSQAKTGLSGLLPQTNNLQQGLLLGLLVLIIALLSWVVYLLIEGRKRGNTNEKIS